MVKNKKTSNAKFNKGDHVVYPSYGPGKILGVKKEIINGKRIQVLIISINERVILRIPVEKILDLGLVGEPKTINPHVLDAFAKSDITPVIAPIGRCH